MDDSFYELLGWGVLFLMGVIGLFLLSRLFVVLSRSKSRTNDIMFGMSTSDMEKLKLRGGLTEDEAKAIRKAMARQLMERLKAEEELRKAPPKAEIALAAAEQQAARLKGATPQSAPSAPRPQPAAPPAPVASTLPDELAPYLSSTELDLESLVAAGFLTKDQAVLIRQHQARTP